MTNATPNLKDFLWYSMDEVLDFHPHVEDALQKAINNLGLSEKLSVVHHPNISGTSTIPDFGVVLSESGKYIFVLEVKRDKQSTESERYWIQTKGYVTALNNLWSPGTPKYFAITNIEEIVLFAERNEHVTRCVLKDGVCLLGNFQKNKEKFDEIKSSFIEVLEKIIKNAYEDVHPEFMNNWLMLIDAFHSTYEGMRSNINNVNLGLRGNTIKIRDISLFELLRLFIYYYLKVSYTADRHGNSSVFRNINYQTSDQELFINSLNNNFQRVLGIDFKQIFSDYPTDERLLPGSISNELFEELKQFISNLDRYMELAVNENPSAKMFFSLLTNKIYSKEELHNEGKVMSDRELARLLAELTIESEDDQIIDPASGDGALLEAAYDKINLLNLAKHDQDKKHEEILLQLHGYEVDSFLNQLATFRLLSKNLNVINNETYVDLNAGDTFDNPRLGEFDVVVMNPPFLRNDDPNCPITADRKIKMLEIIEEHVASPSFLREATQPNLYFYFINWIFNYLKEDGKAGVILMAKFMNNSDGLFLKEFLREHVETVLLYPAGYFSEFKVTTCILILRKNSSQGMVNFLKINNKLLLENPSEIKRIINEENEGINSEYSLRKVARNDLLAEDNWKLYLLDPQNNFDKLFNIDGLCLLSDLFPIVARGGADNVGGSKTVFLNPLDKISENFNLIDREYIGSGFQNNKLGAGKRRHFIIRDNELEFEKAIHFPGSDSDNFTAGLKEFDDIAKSEYGNGKWRNIARAAFRSKIIAQVLVPRADRKKHAIYFIPEGNETVISTNFFYLNGYVEGEFGIQAELKVITGYLMSSFGQLQFELVANNQEGMRKLEGFMLKKVKSINPSILSNDEIHSIVNSFEEFDEKNIDVSGLEGVTTARRGLDLAISKIIIDRNPNIGFRNPEDLANFIELLVEDVVNDRINL